MYLATGINREMSNLIAEGGAVPTSLEGLVEALGGTRQATAILGNNPRTEKPYAQRDMQRYLDYERRGKLPSNRITPPQVFNKLHNAVIDRRIGGAFRQMQRRGLRVRTTAQVLDPSGLPAGERTIVAEISGEGLDNFLAALLAQITHTPPLIPRFDMQRIREKYPNGFTSAELTAEFFNEAVMDYPSSYNFPGARIDAGPDAVPRDDFHVGYAF